MCPCSTSAFEDSCRCTVLDMPERKGNDGSDRLASKASITSGLRLEKSEMLRNLRHYPQAQSRGHHTIDCLEERSLKRGSARHSSKELEMVIVDQTNIETVSKATLGTCLREGWSSYFFSFFFSFFLFRAHRYLVDPNGTDLN